MTRTPTAISQQPSRRFWARLADVGSLYRQRRALAEMPASMLDDIGISRAEALSEAAKPLWDAPQHWLK